MYYDYNKINDLINMGRKYIYKERYNEWVKYVIDSIFNNDNEAEKVVQSMKLLYSGNPDAEVLDYIYSTRLPIQSILNIIDTIKYYYIKGPTFFRSIYGNYLTTDMKEEIKKIEEENNTYKKHIKSRKKD